ncbi:MAG: hypothetical protein Q4G50_05705 [Corynebacterium sp.]|uniref:hypothetical protein n=1 Tax=Corynebacterium sp. TaxID=1720 RepID=UPI0026DF9C9B|nr:hypothetical protein [Corynebacterium sp.]MDO5669480.1 hypothetical protein [Corynebacterium sp.]
MNKTQATVIISLLALTLLAGIGIIALLVRGGGVDAGDTDPPSTSSVEATASEKAEVDAAALLEGTDIYSIHPEPAPDAPQEWGEYQLRRSWDGMTRVFANADFSPISDDGGGRFPATMNRCGIGMYLVTFKSVNPNVDIAAQLIDAAGGTAAEENINEGWSLSTNCETPAYVFLNSSDISNLGDVAYTVHEYMQSSTSRAEPQAAPTTNQATEPTVVQCLGYLGPAQGLYSDGVERLAPECEGSPEQQRAIRGEGVCGGLYGWMEVSAEEYRDLCGIDPPTNRTPPPAEPAPIPEEYYEAPVEVPAPAGDPF